jgi:hypothetical protein
MRSLFDVSASVAVVLGERIFPHVFLVSWSLLLYTVVMKVLRLIEDTLEDVIAPTQQERRSGSVMRMRDGDLRLQ